MIESSENNPDSTENEASILPTDGLVDVSHAKCPALSTYDPRLVLRRHKLLPDEIMRGRDFRKMVLRDNYPIPTDDFREGYCLGWDISYWMTGLVSFLKVMNTIERFEMKPQSVLDFGSASGRVARHFRNQLDDVSVWAADINPNHVRWLATHIPRNPKAILVGDQAGLPIADNKLDLITAFSVFTHIDKSEMNWLAELRRVLRPGGLCYLTVHNNDTWHALSRVDPENRLIKSMLKTPSFNLELLQQPIPEGKTVYHFANEGLYRSQVFHSDNYLREVWGQFFEVLEIQPCCHFRQSVVVLRK